MRRALLLLCLFTVVPSFGLVRLGIQGGITSANVSLTPTATTSARGGLGIGGILEVFLGGAAHLQLEGLYLQKGYVVPATSSVAEQTVRLDYIQLPVMLKYAFDLVLIKPFVMAGPYLGIKAKADYVLGNTTTTLPQMSSSDLGLTFGGGLEVGLSPVTGLFASARYDLGLSNLDDSISGNSTKNSGFMLLGGFLFGI